MEELINRLRAIPNSYFGFVAGISTYAKGKPSRLRAVLDFMDQTPNATSSDIVKFVMDQPDFHDDSVASREGVPS